MRKNLERGVFDSFRIFKAGFHDNGQTCQGEGGRIMTLPPSHQDSPHFDAYCARVEALEAEGLTTSDAQGVADVEFRDA